MINYLKDVSKNTPIGMLPDIINFNNDSIESEFNNIYDSSLNRVTKSVYAPTGSVKAHFGEFVNLSAEYLTVKNVESLKNTIQQCVDDILATDAASHANLTGLFSDDDMKDVATEYSKIVKHPITHDAATIYVNRGNGQELNAVINELDTTDTTLERLINDSVADISTRIDGVDQTIADLSSNVDTVIEYAENVSSNLKDASVDLNSKIANVDLKVDELSVDVSANSNLIVDLSANIADLSTNVASLKLDVESFDVSAILNYHQAGQNIKFETSDETHKNIISAVGYIYDEHNNFYTTGFKSSEPHTFGQTTTGAVAIGSGNNVTGDYSHAEGYKTVASRDYSHAEGCGATTYGDYSHAEGCNTIASGDYSHAEGISTEADGLGSHTEGNSTNALGECSHAEGEGALASGNYSHAEGYNTEAAGDYSHAEGYNTEAAGDYSHAEGDNTGASSDYSHAEGSYTTANGHASHAEGYNTIASGDYSHAEGGYTLATGSYSKSSGSGCYSESTETYVIKAIDGGMIHAKATTSDSKMSATDYGFTIAKSTSSHSNSADSSAGSIVAANILGCSEIDIKAKKGSIANVNSVIPNYTAGSSSINAENGGCAMTNIDAYVSDGYITETAKNAALAILNASIWGDECSRFYNNNTVSADSGSIAVFNLEYHTLSSVSALKGSIAIGHALSSVSHTTDIQATEGAICVVCDKSTSAVSTQSAYASQGSIAAFYNTNGGSVNAQQGSLAIGYSNGYSVSGTASAYYGSIAIGSNCSATTYSIANGYNNDAVGHSLVLGHELSASSCSVVVGTSNSAAQSYSMALGYGVTASSCSVVVGSKSSTNANVSASTHSITIGDAIGNGNILSSNHSISIGSAPSGTSLSATSMSVAIGEGNILASACSMAIGDNVVNATNHSMAIGSSVSANGYSIAIGAAARADAKSFAWGSNVNAFGFAFTAGQDCSIMGIGASPVFAFGQHILYNKINVQYPIIVGGQYPSLSLKQYGENLLVIGNGTSYSAVSNAFRVNVNGEVYGKQSYHTSGADYAEYFEWEDGNPDDIDRIGKFVQITESGKIKVADSSVNVIGVISATASVVGNTYDDQWKDMYVTDVYGRIQYDTYLDKDRNLQKTPRINPEYDPSKQYIPRSARKEWDIVGLLGQLIIDDDGTCEVGGFCDPNENGIATAGSLYRVIKRLDDSHIMVLANFL